MTAHAYTTDILRLAASLGEPRELDSVHGQAELRSPTCGSVIRLTVELDDHRRVKCLSQAVQACAFGQASAALMEQGVTGMGHKDAADALLALSAWLSGARDDPGEWPGLDVLEPARSRSGRHGAILLPFRTLLAALEDAK
ncbi:iron-sulfur cluster assembly scaffold protein [Sphingomonas lutea]|uniref:Iron-sulfur cluster assembly scaffold protein n=1 Tax=Sphingomonas lutea TaxID=1045317 RepID=A0A7G9SKA5_9SPHN|nr:iron-sulfur cluster assembly scaffold protein [Sphingomonas lutea]QNN68280.1 iron-sulfur cluster assembly scaffold protein [Sphingomonas lutea]